MRALDPAVVEFIHGGVAMGVVTRDDSLRPAIARAWGPEVSADGRTLRLCVAAPQGSAARENLQVHAPVAVGFSPPTIARAVQLKGLAVSIGEPEPDDLERVERHVEQFVAEVTRIGGPEHVARRMFAPAGLLEVSVSIDEVFDQTPGPTAGRRL